MRMKFSPTLLSFIFFATLLLALGGCTKEDEQLPAILVPQGSDTGTAVIVSGASARIAHEIALLERLQELGHLNDVQFISGLSSGAICSITLNAVLDESNPFKWNDIKKVLFSLKNDSLLQNTSGSLPIDTRKMWHFFDRVIKGQMGFTSFEKLKIPTIITTIRTDNRKTGLCTNIEGYNSVTKDPVEGLMCSTSVPVAFPSIRVNSVNYADGGINGTVMPVVETLEYQLHRGKKFKKIILVTFQRNKAMQWDKELELAGVTGVARDLFSTALKALGYNLDASTHTEFINQLKYLRENYPILSEKVWVYTPSIENPPYFGFLDFNNEENAYTLVKDWANTHDPVPLDEYLTP